MMKNLLRTATLALALAAPAAAIAAPTADAAGRTVWCTTNPAPGTCNADAGDQLNLLLPDSWSAAKKKAFCADAGARGVVASKKFAYCIDVDF